MTSITDQITTPTAAAQACLDAYHAWLEEPTVNPGITAILESVLARCADPPPVAEPDYEAISRAAVDGLERGHSLRLSELRELNSNLQAVADIERAARVKALKDVVGVLQNSFVACSHDAVLAIRRLIAESEASQ